MDERMVSECGKLAVMDQMLKRLIKDGHKVCKFYLFTSLDHFFQIFLIIFVFLLRT